MDTTNETAHKVLPHRIADTMGACQIPSVAKCLRSTNPLKQNDNKPFRKKDDKYYLGHCSSNDPTPQ